MDEADNGGAEDVSVIIGGLLCYGVNGKDNEFNSFSWMVDGRRLLKNQGLFANFTSFHRQAPPSHNRP